MNLDENIKIAILFNVVNVRDILVYFPLKPVIGTVSDDGNLFTDIMTGKKTLSLDMVLGIDEEECFGMLINAPTLLKVTNEKTVDNAISKLWNNMIGKAFIYGFLEEDNTTKLYPLEDESFKLLFGYSLEADEIKIEDHNRVLEDFVSGKISDEDYSYFLENGKLPDRSCKILNISFGNNGSD